MNAAAGYKLYGGPLIIVDFGTATTFCAVTKEGEYLGGAITPGIKISAEALFQRASKLPRFELIKPEKVIGGDTISAMQAGLIFGYAGLVDGIVERMKRELSPDARVIATGGLAELVSPETKTIQEVRPQLTLEGLQTVVRYKPLIIQAWSARPNFAFRMTHYLCVTLTPALYFMIFLHY